MAQRMQYVLEGPDAVQVGFARAEQVQVRTVDDKDALHGGAKIAMIHGPTVNSRSVGISRRAKAHGTLGGTRTLPGDLETCPHGPSHAPEAGALLSAADGGGLSARCREVARPSRRAQQPPLSPGPVATGRSAGLHHPCRQSRA